MATGKTGLDVWKESIDATMAKRLIQRSVCGLCPLKHQGRCEGYNSLYRLYLNYGQARQTCDDKLDVFLSSPIEPEK